MSKRLEDFIRENKKDFDRFNAPADLWSKIELQLQNENSPLKKERVVKLSFLLKVAAIVVIMLSITISLWRYQHPQTLISSIDPELAKQQVYYTSLIEVKRSELKRTEKHEPELYKTFASELKKMDLNYQQLKQELPVSPNQEQTVIAMIKNLEVQIQVLNQQLHIIQQISDLKKHGNNDRKII
ncbi:MAG TPA: hypothetical protein VNI52_05495 [Sphingobacteriaceae bacterium]|nr:hypothetical protein [Sphingobacteriaceae bacterium]